MKGKIQMTKYSIHRALSEIKTLDARIIKAINGGKFVGYKKNSAKGDYSTNLPVEDFEKDCKSNLDSVKALIKRRDTIKAQVVNSNATTQVEIAGITMTVASVIERKESIKYEKALLQNMINQYNDMVANVNRRNEMVANQIQSTVNNMMVGENATNAKSIDMAKSYSEAYRADNGWTAIDPIGLKAEMEALEEYITTFENEVDHILVTSNAITMVEIED
jgi:hypothetical protein